MCVWGGGACVRVRACVCVRARVRVRACVRACVHASVCVCVSVFYPLICVDLCGKIAGPMTARLFSNPGLQELSTFNLSFRRPGSEAYVPKHIRLPEQLPATDQSPSRIRRLESAVRLPGCIRQILLSTWAGRREGTRRLHE